MNFRLIRSTLPASTALGAIAGSLVALTSAAQAQMYSTGPGFYLSAEGRYLWNAGSKTPNYFYADNPPAIPASIPDYDTATTAADHGFGGKAMLGYRFANNWDVGIGGSLNHLKGKDQSSAPNGFLGGPAPPPPLVDTIKTTLTYSAIDFEAGYNMAMGRSSMVRLFGGLRFGYFDHKAKGTINDVEFRLSFLDQSGERKTTFMGIGPRVGANGSIALGSGFNLFGGVSGALLAGRFKDRHTFTPFFLATPADIRDTRKTKLVPNAEGEVGIGYNFVTGGGSSVGLQLGYRGDAWWGTASKGYVIGPPQKQKTSGDDLFHGPFVRLVASFGTPRPAPVATPPAPPPAPTISVRSFVVFFDFDRSTITPEGFRTINDAVAAAKAGNASRINLTGHADRAGSETYNMALSMRRAEAVRTAMVNLGIPASVISIVARGETQPLVPTADGVREPQNRRVEIVI